MDKPIRLISTDFDGTLVPQTDAPYMPEELTRVLHQLKGSGVLWAVNTGRTLEQLAFGLQNIPVAPDFALTSEREIFKPNEEGYWEDYGAWNAHSIEAYAEMQTTSAPLIQAILEMVQSTSTLQMVYMGETAVGVVASEESELDKVAEFIDAHRMDFGLFYYQRNSVYLRFCHIDYHKGGSLRELSRLLHLERSEVLAIGDSFNDLSMLDGVAAKHVACPSNALVLVKDSVRRAGGFIASEPESMGALQALYYYFPELKRS